MYQEAYINLCNKGRVLKEQYQRFSGLEKHRILPGHQGGEYIDSNLTYLTHSQHILAHWLLWKIHRNVGDRIAWKMMSGQLQNPLSDPEVAKRVSEKLKGYKHTSETRKRMSEAAKGKKNASGKRTAEQRERMRQGQLGKKRSVAHRKAISEAMKRRYAKV